MSRKHVASEAIVLLQNQFRDKVAENVQKFLSRVDKRRLGDSSMGTASTTLILAMNRSGNWYASGLEKTIRKELKDEHAEKKKSKTPRATNPALQRKYILSESLAQLMGTHAASRQDGLKQVWSYIKEHNLKDGSGKIKVNKELERVLGSGTDGLLRNTEIMGLLSKNFIRPTEDGF
jgi:chromatin remodeling complex protein RSC6